MSEESDRKFDEPRRKSPATAWTLAITALLVLYVLSFGPIAYLHRKKVIPTPLPSWVHALYGPVFWLEENTPLSKPLDAYASWWASLAVKD